jgi:hypothetical protein
MNYNDARIIELEEELSVADADHCCANDNTRAVAVCGEFCGCSRCRGLFGLDDEPAIPFDGSTTETYNVTEYAKFTTDEWEIADWAFTSDDINEVAEWFADLESFYLDRGVMGQWTTDGFLIAGSLYTV